MSFSGPKKYKWWERFTIHEIGRIDGGRGFGTGGNVVQIGENTFYDWKNKILLKIPEFKRSGIGIIAEFRQIPSGFPNQGLVRDPVISLPLAQLGFDALCNKMTERMCQFSLLPLGKLKREALPVAVV
jgi:hypothetical protein